MIRNYDNPNQLISSIDKITSNYVHHQLESFPLQSNTFTCSYLIQMKSFVSKAVVHYELQVHQFIARIKRHIKRIISLLKNKVT